MTKKIALSIVTFLLLFFLLEGILSWFFATSWRREFSQEPALPVLRKQLDEERFQAAATNPGPYRVHPDPRVRYVLKGSHEQTIKAALVRSDALGLRAHPGLDEPESAFRIAVLGDSVAFGWGLAGEFTLASQLESILNAGRGPEEQPIVCRTVAIPGWNVRNAVYFLLDHFDELRPDLVLFMPVQNDLEDSDSIYDTGHRRNDFDLLTPHPFVIVKENYRYLFAVMKRLQKQGKELTAEDAGASALLSGLTAASRWRIEDAVESLLELRDRLRQHAAELLLVPYQQHDVYSWIRYELLQRGEEIATIPLLEQTIPEDTLGQGDAHPNQDTVRALALWIAEALQTSERVPEKARTLPPVGESYRRRRATLRDRQQLEDWRQQLELRARESLLAEVVEATGRGIHQLYGGINLDGSIGPELLLMLKADNSNALTVAVAPLESRPDLYPLTVDVEVDGIAVGEIPLNADSGQQRVSFPLPEDRSAAAIEVRLISSHWGAEPIHGSSSLVSVRFVSARCGRP